MNTSDPIKIGFPSNSRIGKDCKPLRQLLRLKGPEGKQTSPYIPNVVFRTARVKDIATFLKQGIFDLGILGNDTAIENGLVDTNQQETSSPRNPRSIYIGEGKFIDAPSKISEFTFPGTDLVIFAKPEALEGIEYPYELLAKGKMATPYPRTAQKILSRLYMRIPQLLENEGGTESIVANRDGEVILGYDIVRTGESIKRLGLVPWKSTVKSYPGLWQSEAISREREDQVRKVRSELKDILRQFTFDESC